MKKSLSLKFALPLALAFALSGCATVNLGIVPVTPCQRNINALMLDSIKLDSIYSYTEDMAELRSVIIASAMSSGIAVIPKERAPEGMDSIRFFFREKAYTKGFKTVLSLAILAEVLDPDGNVLYQVTYLYDGEDSFDSMGFLKNAVDEIFRDLSKVLAKDSNPNKDNKKQRSEKSDEK